MRFAELDAVTIDGFGTLLQLVDPVPALAAALFRHGVSAEANLVAAAFRAEGGYYRPRSHEGRDEESLARLRRECAGVFLEAAGAPLDPAAFAEDFIGALRFEVVPGAAEAVRDLRSRGLPLAVVANWDVSLHERLGELGVGGFFDAVVTSAEAGAPKPDPAIFRLALRRLGAAPAKSVHVGDEPLDEEGARAAGMRFLPAPLATAFEGWS
jgi:putative hydrolase of the HAD superfamily